MFLNCSRESRTKVFMSPGSDEETQPSKEIVKIAIATSPVNPAVHRFDAARLVRLTLEGAPVGVSGHAVVESGVSTKAIAEAIGAGPGLPVVSIMSDEAEDHFGWMSGFLGMDAAASNTITRELLGWDPTHHGLLVDPSEDHYYRDRNH